MKFTSTNISNSQAYSSVTGARTSASRRQFLRGAGGFTLALPVLPSLLPRDAQAATAQPKLIALASDHGAVWVEHMCPAVGTLTEKQQLYATHTISSGALKRNVEGSKASLSPILSAPGTLLTDRIVSKMNVLLGVDIPFGIAHHSGGHLGNYAANDGNEAGGKAAQAFPRPTVDQVLAWSPKFYGSLDAVKERVLVAGYKSRLSFNYSNPAAKTGELVAASSMSPTELFDRVFMGGVSATQPTGPAPRPAVVDKILADYRSLRQGNKRLSTSDKQRLDDYMGRLDELQRRLSVKPVNPVLCKMVPKPGSSMSAKEYFSGLNDVVVAAFLCGGSRIATIGLGGGDGFTPDYRGDWHEQVAHSTWRAPEPMATMVEAQRRMFEWAFLDLAQKLDVDAGGGSLLDQTLLQWSSESGPESHSSISQPIIMAGGAAGYFKTGMFVDYRNIRPSSSSGNGTTYGDTPRKYAGLVHNRWLGTILQSMGLSPSDYERDGVGGYGKLNLDGGVQKLFTPQALTDLSAPMPMIHA